MRERASGCVLAGEAEKREAEKEKRGIGFEPRVGGGHNRGLDPRVGKGNLGVYSEGARLSRFSTNKAKLIEKYETQN